MDNTTNKPFCIVCGGTDYYNDAGFYFCSECHTQAKDVQETIFGEENNFTSLQTTRVTIKTKKADKNQGKAGNWTSWHGHNYVLKGLADELLKLGAEPKLKFVILQLWTKYLGKIEAAFFSKTDVALPKFALNQHKKDYDIIYPGSKKFKKKRKILRKKINRSNKVSVDETMDANTTRIDQKKKLVKIRKTLVKAEYERVREELTATQDVLSQVDDRLKRSSQQIESVDVSPVTIQYSQEALRLRSMREERLERKGMDASSVDVSSKPINNTNPHLLTRMRLVALIALALHITQAKIQISDLLRWIIEGHVSYYKVAHLFPESVVFTAGDAAFLAAPSDHLTYQSLLVSASNIARLINVKTFPTPDLVSLARRYVLELQLPDGLIKCVARLIAASSHHLIDTSSDHHIINYEAYTMAYILVALKMLFGLDDSTEHSTSDVARHVNSLKPDGIRDRLFVWDDWVRYVECRKSLLMREHFPTRFRLGEKMSSPSWEPYMQFIEAHQKKDEVLEKRLRLSGARGDANGEKFSETLRRSINHLPDYKCSDAPGLTFAPSLTPNTSYLATILKSTDRAALPFNVLSQDFTKTSLEFLTDPTAMKELATANGLNISVREGRIREDAEIVPMPLCTHYDLSGSKHNKRVIVHIVDDDEVESENDADNEKPEGGKRKRSELETEADPLNTESKRCKLSGFRNFSHEVSPHSEEQRTCSQSRLCSAKGGSHQDGEGSPSNESVQFKLSGDGKKLMLHLPYNDYWMFHCTGLSLDSSQSEFELKVASNIPASFYWLLKQCSQVLQMSGKDLYVHLCKLEQVLD